MQKTKILSTGMYVPDFVVTNDLLAQVMDTSDEWITQRTGIKQRRVIPDTYKMLQQLAQAPDKREYRRRNGHLGSRLGGGGNRLEAGSYDG
jgi:hypothetical protein